MYEIQDEKYTIYTDYDDQDKFRVKLQCMDPSSNLRICMEQARSTILFSATLLPIQYYKEQLGGTEEDYAIYAPSAFPPENRLILIGNDVSSKYTRRNKKEYRLILNYIKDFTSAVLVIIWSFSFLSDAQALVDMAQDELEGLVVQSSGMSEEERESFRILCG